MRVVFFTPWNNVWVRYIQKYFDKQGVEAEFVISSQIDLTKIRETDVAVFCWADKSVIDLSRYCIKFSKTIVFVRSYEIFFGYVHKINWKHVDDVIFVNKMFYDEYKDQIPSRVHYLPNAIDLDEWQYQHHKPGYNVGMVAHLSHKKGIDLIPQFLYELRKHGDYKLHMAGENGEDRHVLYVEHILNQMGISDSVVFYGNVSDIKEWWRDKDYLFTCSVTEGHPNNVIEAMSLGVKPIIHNWIGAKDSFPEKLIWTNIAEAVNLVTEETYDSTSYRQFIKDNYDMWKVYPRLEEIIRA